MKNTTTDLPLDFLRSKCGEDGLEKLLYLDNPTVTGFISRYVEHCNPDRAFVRSSAKEDADYIRRRAIERGEEIPLRMGGHTVHFDGYYDQARDRGNTKFLIRPGEKLGSSFVNSVDRENGLEEMHGHLKNIMVGHEAYICFYSLGPMNSVFSIPALQITDSSYVAHSEDMLYRDGYELFRTMKMKNEEDFFKFVHSAGELDNCNSKNLENRRIYTDLKTNTIFSVNTQYGGNTIGPKKLGMRLAIKKASMEGWLTEHMFIMGVRGPGDRISYFAGAYPSACGKTSTSMIEGETLVGDDIAYIREVNGEIRAVNPEQGIFGIIRDVNPEDDPLIWKAIRKPGEVIVSNILVHHGKPYWLGMGVPLPDRGFNHSGKWWEGKQDADGNVIGPAHLNARYTLRISDLANMDPNLDNPEGIRLDGIIYGARDADTWLPVEEAFDWEHGVLTKGAILESESTAATLGKSGLRTFNPMANIDFLSIPIGEYLENHVKLGRRLKKPPRIFSANYFLRNKQGKFITKSQDKRVWLKWMELRVHEDVGAVVTPTGLAPIYEDLRVLFKRILGRNYSRDEYDRQFKIRVRENLSKIDRMFKIYREKVQDVPQVLSEALESQRERLDEARRECGDYLVLSDYRGKPGVIQEIRPGDFESLPRELYPNAPRTI